MLSALRDAHVDASDIGYVNAHATSTPLGDAAESRALQRLFVPNELTPPAVSVSSTKGSIGHLLGAAGAVESIFSLLSCSTGFLPPTLNCSSPDINCDTSFHLVGEKSEAWPEMGHRSRRVALTNSFGFGGTNVSLCIGSFVL